jgi:hypothetical protein
MRIHNIADSPKKIILLMTLHIRKVSQYPLVPISYSFPRLRVRTLKKVCLHTFADTERTSPKLPALHNSNMIRRRQWKSRQFLCDIC